MNAVVLSRYGGPEAVEFKEQPAPAPSQGQLLIRVRAASVNPIDWKIRNGEMKYFVRQSPPFVLGADLSGEVAELGPGASKFAVGDRVYAACPGDTGAQAGLVAISEKHVAKMPKGMDFAEAASVPATAMTALQALRDKAAVAKGQKVLVNGASGGVGIFAVQVAKAFGAAVTAVCSQANFELVKGLGADQLVDYKAADFAAGPERYHLVFDCVANRSLAQCKNVIEKNGGYLTTMPTAGHIARALLNPVTSAKALSIVLAPKGEDLATITSLIEEGKVRTVVDKVFPAAQVAEAHRYSETGRAKGKIVLTFA